MGDYNRIILHGNMGSDPEKKEGENWKIGRFSLCTNRTWTQNGDRKSEATWHNVVVFNQNTVDYLIKYGKKGSRVLVEGRLAVREYEKDGQKRRAYEVVVDRFDGNINIENPRSADKEEHDPEDPRGGSLSSDQPFDDDIPF